MTKTPEELIELTPEQVKAWKKIVAGMKQFTAAGGEFYSNLDTLSGYNGKYVEKIEANETGDCQADDCGMPSVMFPGLCSFADDDAGVFFNNKGLKMLGEEEDE